VYFPSSLSLYRSPSGIGVQVAWAIPVYAVEAEWIANHGWRAFQELLDARSPNLLDLDRPPTL
jgi:hypothetical protein